MEESGDFGVSAGGEGGGSAQLPGESTEDYIARLKKMGLYGGDITEQPVVGGGGPSVTGFGGVATPGSSSGLSVGSGMTSGGLSPGTGAGALSGKGMWEPDNSGSVSARASPSGGGGTQPGGDHITNALSALMGGGSSPAPAPQIAGSIGTGNFGNATPLYTTGGKGRNLLARYLDYTQPAYRSQPNPFLMNFNNGAPATNYLQQLMRGGR